MVTDEKKMLSEHLSDTVDHEPSLSISLKTCLKPVPFYYW